MRISDWSSDVCSSDLYVFLCGLIPAAVAFGVRLFVKEPERWTRIAQNSAPPRLGELFSPQFRRITLSGFLMAVIALITWWSCNAFLPVRSEEHTSELQSLMRISYAVFCLKKKTRTIAASTIINQLRH